MKNKIRFILPRLIGLTLVIGIISFFIVAIFKILAMLTLTLAIGALVLSRIRKKAMRKKVPTQRFDSTDQAIRLHVAVDTASGIVPVGAKRAQVAIIPIH